MRLTCQPGGHNRGYTAMELIVTVVIVTLLVAAALPAFKSTFASTQLSSVKSALIVSLQRARVEALSSGRDVVLCPSANQRNCNDDSDWSEGWLLYRDDNFNGRFDPVEPMLLSQKLDASQVDVHSNGGRRRITYRNLGESAGSNATFVLCSRSLRDRGAQVIVSNSGRVRSLNFAPDSACAES